MDELLEELILAPGIPGYEDRVRELVAARLPDGVPAATDSMGNLVATLGDSGPAVMFVAHMDEIGFVVSEVRDDGFLRLKPLGGIDPRTVFGRAVRVVTETGEVAGVVAVTPPHLMRDRAREMKDVPAVEEMLLDVGARSGGEAADLGVKVLDFAVLAKTPRVLNGKYVCARALDDRAGCWVLLRALERLVADGCGGTVHFAFSVQEEVGLRGAARLARAHALEYAFAVDSVSTADWPGVGSDLSPARLGQGACLRVLDNATVIPPAFRKELEGVAREHGIPLQTVFTGGGTDAKPFQAEGPQVMSIGIPLRYTHSAVEMAHTDDLAATVDFVSAVARHYTKPAG